MPKYYLPSIGGQIENPGDSPTQSSPLLNTYSPRLFGSPPQLTHLNDMRLASADPDSGIPGPVGDFYLKKILQDSPIVNFTVGKALFTGGQNGLANIIRIAIQYGYAMKKYDIYQSNGDSATGSSTTEQLLTEANLETYNSALATDDGTIQEQNMSISNALTGSASEEDTNLDISNMGNAKSIIESLSSLLTTGGALLSASMLTSLSVQQPFYTFEADWYSYINNVKTMINTAVIMLGLQNACVRIGDMYYPIGMNVNVTKDTDVWSNYRFITPSKGLGDVLGLDTQVGDSTQYVSFMTGEPNISETYSNETGTSQIYSKVLSSGNEIGNEIAFITNSTSNRLDDAVINLAGDTISSAEKVLTALSAGAGRFTAAIAGSMARSYVGDHTIYPDVHKSSESTSSMTIQMNFQASSGDPYSQLTEVLVPLFFILCMAQPAMSKNSSAAYSFPPLIQCNIPGMWGCRLGMVTSVTVTKNPNGTDVSINGYPLAISVSLTITDLQHVQVTSGMNNISLFLNNHTMFDYIAQCAGVDKYRINGSIRLVSRLALAASAVGNMFHNIGDAFLSDFTSFANKLSGVYRL